MHFQFFLTFHFQPTTDPPHQLAKIEDTVYCLHSNSAMSLISSRIAGVRTKRGSPSVGIESLTESFRREVEAEARKATLKRFENSEFGKDINALPTFDMNELVLGKRLGKGGFSNVDEIRGILLQRGKTHNTVNHIFKSPRFKCNRNDSMAFNDIESRKFIADHCFRRSGDARYAIKRARREVLNDEEKVFFGLLDLAIETKFLSSLEHPNIIKLRAISSVDPFSDGYFLVLDRLYDTLQKRIVAWREKHKRLDSFWGRLRDRRGRKRLNFFEHRVERAYDLSEALKYLHGECIIHRDAKPENIGFDCVSDS